MVQSDDVEDIQGGRPSVLEAYGWPEAAKVLALFFVPLLLVGALWLVIDNDGLRRVASGTKSDVLVAALTLVSTSMALTYMSVRNHRHGLTWEAFGVRKTPLGRSIKYVVGFLVLTLLTVVAFGAVMVALHVPEPEVAARPARDALEWMWVLAGAVVVGPIGEEIIYRGMLFGFLRHRHRFAVAALISSVVFMLVHVAPVAFVTTLPLGLYLCFMYKRLGSIVPGVVLHMIWNLMIAMVK